MYTGHKQAIRKFTWTVQEPPLKNTFPVPVELPVIEEDAAWQKQRQNDAWPQPFGEYVPGRRIWSEVTAQPVWAVWKGTRLCK